MWEPMLGEGPDRAARVSAFVADTPMRRFGTVEEVAAIALLLASDEAAYMTGTELTLDGGLLAGSAAAPKTDRASRNEVLAPVLVEMACPPSRTGGGTLAYQARAPGGLTDFYEKLTS